MKTESLDITMTEAFSLVRIPEWLGWMCANGKLSTCAMLVWGRLFTLVRRKGYAYCSQKYIRETIGIPERTTRGALAELRDLGLVTVKRVGVIGESRNRYYLFVPTNRHEMVFEIDDPTGDSVLTEPADFAGCIKGSSMEYAEEDTSYPPRESRVVPSKTSLPARRNKRTPAEAIALRQLAAELLAIYPPCPGAKVMTNRDRDIRMTSMLGARIKEGMTAESLTEATEKFRRFVLSQDSRVPPPFVFFSDPDKINNTTGWWESCRRRTVEDVKEEEAERRHQEIIR